MLEGLFAWLSEVAEPRMDRTYGPLRRRLLAGLEGTVLEIGPGTGPNLRYYPPSVERWIGVEPNPHMRTRLLRRASDVRPGRAERLPVEDASVDAVVATLVLCSVRDVEQALREIRRVLRPGGRFLFLEHVAAPRGTPQRLGQRLIRPLCGLFGCHPDRETGAALEQAFGRVEMERLQMPVPLLSPHIMGSCVR